MNVVLDLDGTIVFPQEAEIAIAGRSRPTFISAGSAHWLRDIGNRADLYVATARNQMSVVSLVRSIPQVRFAGFVLECGLVHRTQFESPLGTTAATVDEADRLDPALDEDRVRFLEHLQRKLIDWEFVPGYQRMICCIAPTSVSDPLAQIQRSAADFHTNTSWRFHQERHKTFASPARLCKATGLRQLGLCRWDYAAGDDFAYDHNMLEHATVPMTLPTADFDLVELVRSRGGFVTHETGHRGAEELLSEIYHRLG